jgi:hypothetical protein
MGSISVFNKVSDKLPAWAKVILTALIILGSVYCIAHYGFTAFIRYVIFSP